MTLYSLECAVVTVTIQLECEVVSTLSNSVTVMCYDNPGFTVMLLFKVI